MVTAIKILVKIIKLFIFFFKVTDGPLADLVEQLEEKYGIEFEEE